MGGAVFIDDRKESKIGPKAWLLVKDVRAGSKIIASFDDKADLVIFHDGVEKWWQAMKNSVANDAGDVFAVVDFQGLVECVELAEQAYPLKHFMQLDDENVSETIKKHLTGT